MKKLFFIPIGLFLFVGCVPKIVSQKSPILDIDEKKCFNFPAKDFILTKDFGNQNLFILSEKALKEFNIKTYYGENKICKNYLLTSWKITQDESLVTDKGSSYTNTYGTINTGLYQYGNISTQSNSYTYTTPDVTYIKKKLYGIYSLDIGTIKDDKIITIWKATQSAELVGTDIEEAAKVEDADYPTIRNMIKTMLIENNFVKDD
ncbi:hypothetical protein [Poseidonibacter ostreae]|uniref:Uncharacterized protein n=1 Tax=Poseidonibacter ostreae TaxID=2654171 RepID=A0A6L4WNJ6_9BACT|nr:hypothetical protein [Poseidonibacter ostreae]KAB7884970.1 hypothetical protein GBG19_14970 [Poseidonibacter ostreae]